MSNTPGQDPTTRPEAWNAVAEGFDDEMFDRMAPYAEAVIERLDVGRDADVLDDGAGTGALAVRLAPRVRRVVATDFASGMIDRLQARVAAAGIANVEASVMDGQALTFPDAVFDASASMFAWFLFPDRADGLAQLLRVTKPGGRVVVTSWLPADRNTMIGAGMAAMREALPDLPRPQGPLPTQIPEVVEGELRAAGLGDVRVELFGADAPMASVDAYWAMMERSGAPLRLLRGRLGPEAYPRVAARIRATLKDRYGEGPFVLRGEAILASGHR